MFARDNLRVERSMARVPAMIPLVRIDSGCPPASHGNPVPLLHEVRHALARLLEAGEPSSIDLRALPMGPGDDEALDRMLGIGEVEASVSVLGSSSVLETSYPGVWIVTHRNEDDQIVSRFIEVAYVPKILASQVPDIQDGYERLKANLDHPGGDVAMIPPEGVIE